MAFWSISCHFIQCESNSRKSDLFQLYKIKFLHLQNQNSLTSLTSYHLVRCHIRNQLIICVFILLQPKVLGVSTLSINFLKKQRTILWETVHLNYKIFTTLSCLFNIGCSHCLLIFHTSGNRIWFIKNLHLLSSDYMLGIVLNASYALFHNCMSSIIFNLLQIKKATEKLKNLL